MLQNPFFASLPRYVIKTIQGNSGKKLTFHQILGYSWKTGLNLATLAKKGCKLGTFFVTIRNRKRHSIALYKRII